MLVLVHEDRSEIYSSLIFPYPYLVFFSINNKTRWHFFMATNNWLLCQAEQSG